MGSVPDCVAFTGGIIISINGRLFPCMGQHGSLVSGRNLLTCHRKQNRTCPCSWYPLAKICKLLIWVTPTLYAACVVYGDIRPLPHTHPAERGMPGYITSDEGNTIPAGRWNSFVGGGIVWRKDLGAATLYGDKWLNLFSVRWHTRLGFPTGANSLPGGRMVTQPFTN